MLGSSWRTDPAAALRGFMKVDSPRSTRRSLSASKAGTRKKTSPRATSRGGAGGPSGWVGMRSGSVRSVRRLGVTSSPMTPLPRVAPSVKTPSS